MADPCFPGVQAPFQLSYFTSFTSIFLAIIISIGNFLIIIAVVRDPERKLRTPFAFFLVNQALSDFMVGILAMPISVMFHYMEAKKLINRTYIYILHLSYFISASASMFSMAAMCIDRYFALVSLSTHRRKNSMFRCFVISLVIWLLAGGFSGFYFLLGYVTLLIIYIHVALISSFCITLLTYVRILKNMREISRTLNNGRNRTERRKRRELSREDKITNVFIAILGAFIGIYVPAFIFVYILQFCLSCSCDARHVLRDLVYLLVSASSATNPIVCIARLTSIRKAVLKAVHCRKPKTYEFKSSFTFDGSQQNVIPQRIDLKGTEIILLHVKNIDGTADSFGRQVQCNGNSLTNSSCLNGSEAANMCRDNGGFQGDATSGTL